MIDPMMFLVAIHISNTTRNGGDLSLIHFTPSSSKVRHFFNIFASAMLSANGIVDLMRTHLKNDYRNTRKHRHFF